MPSAAGRAGKIDCEAKNYFPPAAKKNEGCKTCNPCHDSPQPECVLKPYRPNCCGKNDQTGHHLIPVHCFMPPGARKAGGKEVYWKGYNEKLAPCICADKAGPDESLGPSHEQLHNYFDDQEDKHSIAGGGSGTWTYKQARDTAARSAKKTFGCKEKCIKAQLDEYHKSVNKDEGALLRADSGGQGTPAATLTPVANTPATGLSMLS
jgi:GHH signature containing HNH/Endo VII superfamily nuclease toxin  2